jgi:hypothetical protein
MAAPTIADAGDHVWARILTYRGVINTGNPWDVTGGGVKATTSLTVTVTGVTTTVPNTLIVQAVARDNDSTAAAFSAQTNANLTGIVERFDTGTTVGNGGGVTAWDGVKATAGATGNTTANVTPTVVNAFLTIALRPGTTSLTIDMPVGTLQDDLMIASVAVTPSTTTITPPAGWTLVRRTDNGSATTNSLAVYRKTATASEPTTYKWTLGGATTAAGGIQSFINVDTSNPIDVENGQATASATAHATPDVTTSVENTFVVTSHAFASSATWSEPSGMTEAFDIASETPTVSAGISITGTYRRQAAAGATGAKTATASGNADTGNTHILALKPATPPLTINKPAGTVANDVMVAAIAFNHDSTVITPPAGWTLVRRIENNNAVLGLEVHYRVAGASEPASYTWFASTSSGNFKFIVGGIQSFSGVGTASPINVDAGQCTLQPTPCGSESLTHATPNVTTTVANTMLVTAHAYESSNTWTPPAGMTEAYDQASIATPNQDGMSIEGNYQLQAAAGATGAKTATAAGTTDDGVTHILALQQAAPGDFNAFETSTPGPIGVIKTKIAGATISFEIIALITPARTTVNTAFTGTVRVEVLDASDNSGSFDGNGCRSSWTVPAKIIQTLSPDPAFVSGDLGRKIISYTVPNSYPDVRLRITYPAGAPTKIGCSNDNFAIRPNTFANFAVTDTDWETAGIGRALNSVTFGAVIHKAGRPISGRATALNAAGTPAVTTNYAGTPTAVPSVCVGAACTATFGTVGSMPFVAGQLVVDNASYDNVGSFAVQLVDSTFASVDASDGSTTTERNITSSVVNVGRFVPDHFAVSYNTPVFGTSCGSFTYIGQAFNYTTVPVITVTAQGFANNTTTLYADPTKWWRITNASLTGKAYTAAVGTVDSSGITGTDPVIADSGGGIGTLTFSSGTGVLFTRSTPVAPFDADVSLAINVIDADGVAYASNPASFGAATAGNGIAFSGGKPMRFGQLALGNALGSEVLNLPIPIQTQYWNGTSFVTNTLDSCTTINANRIVLSNYQGALNSGNLPSGNISTGGAFNAGVGNLKLTKPSSAVNGSVDLCVDLDTGAGGDTTCQATPAGVSYLQGAWSGTTYTFDPRARAAFGFSKGSYSGGGRDPFVYQRENY